MTHPTREPLEQYKVVLARTEGQQQHISSFLAFLRLLIAYAGYSRPALFQKWHCMIL